MKQRKNSKPYSWMRRFAAAFLCMALILPGVILTGCGSSYSTGTEDLTVSVDPGDCGGDEPVSGDPQAVMLTGVSVSLFADTWAFCGENENFLMSPLSLIEVLGMVSEGADGETRSQLEELFGYGTNTISQHMRYLSNNLPSSKGARLDIANSIWIRDSRALQVKDDFLKAMKGYYDAEVFRAAFDQATVDDINQWCSDKTDGMIEKMLEQIEAQQMMFLINAICFDAKWQEPYEKGDVFEDDFYTEEGIISQASYMRSNEGIYLGDENTTGFRKLYKEGYSFAALLPEEGLTMEEYLADFTGEKLQNLLRNQSFEPVYSMLPKFSGETSMKLSGMLQQAGVTDVFDSEKADLLPMAELNGESLYVSEIIQKTFIEVDEQGTKAAAVTMAMAEGSAEAPMKVVKLDRPFVYMILEDESNTPIFLGVVMDPVA